MFEIKKKIPYDILYKVLAIYIGRLKVFNVRYICHISFKI